MSIPCNRVRALDLEQALTREFAKQTWRDATAAAMRRWLAAGNKPQRYPSGSTRSARKPRYTYRED